MSEWTDERIDALRRLWLAGVSAKRIAAELGGLTRNAVMGKVDRVGLMGADRVPIKDPDVLESIVRKVMKGETVERMAPVSEIVVNAIRENPAEPAPTKVRAPRKKAASKTAKPAIGLIVAPTVVAISPRPSLKAVTVPDGPVEIMALRDYMCKWPMGDPGSPEFRYCGQRSRGGAPYCEGHARMAYMPSKSSVRSASSAGR